MHSVIRAAHATRHMTVSNQITSEREHVTTTP